MEYRQITDCKEWQFKSIPAFNKGKMHMLFTDCGNGLSLIDKKNDDCSYMHIFSEVTPQDISSYALELEKGGYTKLYKNEINGSLFYQFKTDEGLLYISYLSKSRMARFILDRCHCDSVSDFGYCNFTPNRDNTVFAQYSLYYDKMISGTSCDCGMNYVFRLRDNSVIIIDGGEMEQSTDEAVADYMDFLHELTGDGKIRISLWLCTHAHNDHCDFFSKILRYHSDDIDVERVAFNFPNPDNVRNSDSIKLLKQRIVSAFPDVKYIKLHAGNSFNIANARFDVFLSSEDTVGIFDDEPFPGTNSTSTIFRVTADDISVLFLADCTEDNGDVLADNYCNNGFECDFLQAAHHGINEIFRVYDSVKANTVLLPQCKMNMDTRFGTIYEKLCANYKEENILFAAVETDIFELSNGKYNQLKRKHTGGAYDNSEW